MQFPCSIYATHAKEGVSIGCPIRDPTLRILGEPWLVWVEGAGFGAGPLWAWAPQAEFLVAGM